MLRSFARVTLTATLLSTVAACTQTPAQIELKGQNTYGKNTLNGYVSANPESNYRSTGAYQPAPVYTNTTVQNASVSAIGVSDLSPPAAHKGWSSADAPSGKPVSSSSVPASSPFGVASKPLPASAPFATARHDAPKPAVSGAVNPWTGKPRPVELTEGREESFNLQPKGKQSATREQMVSEVHTRSDKPVAQLDSIISNDGSGKKADAVISKPVVADASGFMWPVNSKKVISSFGPKGGGKVNDGINIASAEGEPVWAAADGEVVYVGNELQGYGNMVLIKHSGGKTTTYAHLSRAAVDKYARVKQGDIIGYVGSTGNVKEPQLHFAIRDGKEPVDPVKYMRRNVASLR